MQQDIVLSTLNASYPHSAFGLRYLKSNLGQLENRCTIQEFTIHKPAQEVVSELMKFHPKIIGFGVYIWNTDQTREVLKVLKAQYPEVLLVLGGPEVSYESEKQEIVAIADFVICGEADFSFRNFCEDALLHKKLPETKVVRSQLPEIGEIQSPYRLYSDTDIQNRIIYVEASRGCPYKCEYCLSSLDKSVRNFPIDSFLGEMEVLFQRGVRQFKFIDRTFNLSPKISCRILEFFLLKAKSLFEKNENLFLHFEMVPDRLPDEIKNLIAQFPEGSLQFEIGVQTWNEKVAALVSRRQDYPKVEENLRYLQEKTHVHTHVDLIGGLPGETLESFAEGFDRLARLSPDEIQVGVLKRLKGTPIIRHDREWEMVYSEKPPFQILSTKTMPAEVIQKFTHFAKFWDLIANRGQFKKTCMMISKYCQTNNRSLFWFYWEMSDFLSQRHQRTYSIHLNDLFESVLLFLESQGISAKEILHEDYHRSTRYYTPEFLRLENSPQKKNEVSSPASAKRATPKRQSQHLQ